MTFEIDEQNRTLSIIFIGGEQKGQISSFKPDKKSIKIGRGKNCEIRINDNGLSRVQCTIIFDKFT